MRNLELKDFLKYTFLSHPIASPDGKKCAFIKTVCDEENNGYRSFIYIYDCVSANTRQLTYCGGESNPVWINENTLIFESERNGQNGFYALPLDGGEAYEYMRFPMKVLKIMPINEDEFILLCNFKYNSDSLFNNESNKTREYALEHDADCYIGDELPFRRDGAGITNGIRNRLYYFNRASGEMMPITQELQTVEFVDLKKERLVYTAKTMIKNAPVWMPSGIYEYNLSTKKTIKHLDDNIYRIRFCAFLNSKIVFAGSERKRYGNQENPFFFRAYKGKVEIISQNELSAANSVVTDCRYGGGTSIAVFEDHIYYSATRGGDGVICKLGLDGEIETLTSPTGTADYFAVCKDRLLFVGQHNHRLQELYELKNGVETRITSFNEWVMDDLTISRPEAICFENDGWKLQGYIIKPVGFNEGKSYPAIVEIHGGHKCAYGQVFIHEMQLLANEGYFIIYCNPRGSDGGDNKLAEIIGKYGCIDYSDIMQFVDVCLERYPQIDRERLGVTGGSYGGYMTNWIIGHTDRFKCAVSQRSMSSFITMFSNSDTGHTFPMYDFKTNIWQDIGKYWELSPLKFADKVRTPTLFLHSEQDFRCPIQEGVQMFTALQYHGVDSRICIFRNEGHELSRSGKPKNRSRRLQEMMNWFNRYLMKE